MYYDIYLIWKNIVKYLSQRGALGLTELHNTTQQHSTGWPVCFLPLSWTEPALKKKKAPIFILLIFKYVVQASLEFTT